MTSNLILNEVLNEVSSKRYVFCNNLNYSEKQNAPLPKISEVSSHFYFKKFNEVSMKFKRNLTHLLSKHEQRYSKELNVKISNRKCVLKLMSDASVEYDWGVKTQTVLNHYFKGSVSIYLKTLVCVVSKKYAWKKYYKKVKSEELNSYIY